LLDTKTVDFLGVVSLIVAGERMAGAIPERTMELTGFCKALLCVAGTLAESFALKLDTMGLCDAT
jgi:hypothetical protein